MGENICACWQNVFAVIYLEQKHQASLPCGVIPQQPSDHPVCLRYLIKHESERALEWWRHRHDCGGSQEHISPSVGAGIHPDTFFGIQTLDCLRCRSITLPWWQASIPDHSSLLEAVFCDRGRLFALALLLHIATLYMSCQIFVICQMTGACLNKFYRGQELVDEGAHSSGSIW